MYNLPMIFFKEFSRIQCVISWNLPSKIKNHNIENSNLIFGLDISNCNVRNGAV